MNLPLNIQKSLLLSLSVWVLLMAAGCKASRFVPEGKVLVKASPGIETDKQIPDATLESGISTKANRKFLLYGPKLALHVHNSARIFENIFYSKQEPIGPEDQVKGIFRKSVRFIKYRMGEPPVLLDTSTVSRDVENLRNIAFANGYFYPKVSASVDTLTKYLRPNKKKRKARVKFTVAAGSPYRIRNVSLHVLDSTQHSASLERQYFLKRSLIKKGELYNHNTFSQERARAVNSLKNAGFFTFNQQMIRFAIDTLPAPVYIPTDTIGDSTQLTPQEKELDVRIEVTETPSRWVVREIVMRLKEPAPPRGEKGSKPIRIRADELSGQEREQWHIPYRRLDSSVQLTFLVDSSLISRVNLNFLASRVRLIEKKGWRLLWADLTRKQLQELGMFRYVVLNHEFLPREKMLVNIEMQMASQYQLKVGAETFSRANRTFTTNLPSVGTSLSFRDKNTFGKSELMELSLGGNVGLLNTSAEAVRGTQFFYTITAAAQFTFNRFLFLKPFEFLLPQTIKTDFSRFSPVSQLATTFNWEQQSQLSQFAPGFNLSYRWNHIPFRNKAFSRLTPIALEFIDPNIGTDTTFRAITAGMPSPLDRDYLPRIQSRLQYSYTHQDYRTTRARPTSWYRLSGEWGGNLLYAWERINLSREGRDTELDNRLILTDSLTASYGQYAKVTVEGKVFIPITRSSEIVVRGIAGGAFTLLGTPILPRESRFFAGGLNGLRGWRSNSLGPGRIGTLGDLGFSSENGLDTLPLNSLTGPGGNYVLELNAEYRFDVGTYLELALFTDVGNVWFNQATADRIGAPKAALNLDNLALGWDAGIGFRFDFSFLILRLDFGQQLRAPDLDNPWVLGNPAVNQPNIRRRFNVGISYPF